MIETGGRFVMHRNVHVGEYCSPNGTLKVLCAVPLAASV